MTTPSKVLSGDTKLRNRFSAHHLHGRLRPVGHIQRPQNPLRKARPPSEDRTTKDKPMDNPPPTLLGSLNGASEERKLRRAEYGRELLAATLAAKRAVLKAQRSRHAAEDAYSARACKVLNRRTIVVHNVGEIAALMELLGEAQPPYGLRTVEVRGPATVGHAAEPLVKQMRENLEANGFELREGNSYALPQKVVPQKVEQQGNQRRDEEEEEGEEGEEDDEWDDDDYDDDEWEEEE
ncbi:hypothetical protein NL676_038275 [Syzygium grande]|nr:hypothetical protein NL676_038275 [Syzygium grande]